MRNQPQGNMLDVRRPVQRRRNIVSPFIHRKPGRVLTNFDSTQIHRRSINTSLKDDAQPSRNMIKTPVVYDKRELPVHVKKTSIQKNEENPRTSPITSFSQPPIKSHMSERVYAKDKIIDDYIVKNEKLVKVHSASPSSTDTDKIEIIFGRPTPKIRRVSLHKKPSVRSPLQSVRRLTSNLNKDHKSRNISINGDAGSPSPYNELKTRKPNQTNQNNLQHPMENKIVPIFLDDKTDGNSNIPDEVHSPLKRECKKDEAVKIHEIVDRYELPKYMAGKKIKVQKRKDKKILGRWAKCHKYYLIILNMTIVVGALVVLLIACWSLHDQSFIKSLIRMNLFTNVLYVFIAISCFVIIICGIGCIGAVTEMRSLLLLHGGILQGVFLCGLLTVALWYIYTSLEKSFLSSMTYYWKYNSSRAAWDSMQTTFQCCGVQSVDDWPKDRIPQSCCPGNNKDEECKKPDTYEVGCLNEANAILYLNFPYITAVIAGVFAFLLSSIAFTCNLCRMLRRK